VLLALLAPCILPRTTVLAAGRVDRSRPGAEDRPGMGTDASPDAGGAAAGLTARTVHPEWTSARVHLFECVRAVEEEP